MRSLILVGSIVSHQSDPGKIVKDSIIAKKLPRDNQRNNNQIIIKNGLKWKNKAMPIGFLLVQLDLYLQHNIFSYLFSHTTDLSYRTV